MSCYLKIETNNSDWTVRDLQLVNQFFDRESTSIHSEFIRNVREIFTKRYPYAPRRFEIIDYPYAYKPDDSSLENQIHYYQKKYDLNNLHLFPISEFARFCRGCKKPGIVGTIATGDDLGHVAPLICIFSDTGLQSIINLDSAGREFLDLKTLRYTFPKVNFYTYCEPRQADIYSCRTDAIVLLRNALLHLGEQPAEFLSQWLEKNAEQAPDAVKSEFKLRAIPLEWDYTSQISNPLLSGTSNTHLIYRTKWSCKEAKRETPLETVPSFRARHSKTVRYLYEIILRNFRIEAPKFDSCTFSIDGYNLHMELEVDRLLNTYLIEKGIRNFQFHGSSGAAES